MRAAIYLIRPCVSAEADASVRRAAGIALERIIGAVPSAAAGQQYLYQRTQDLLGGEPPLPPNGDGQVELWRWDIQRKAASPERYDAALASLTVASRAAADLYALAPENVDYRRLYLTVRLKSDKFAGGLDQPLQKGPSTAYAEAVAAGPEAVDEVLSYAMSTGHPAAAVGAAEVLADIGDIRVLASKDGRPRALAAALLQPDRRLRFTAAETILKLDPQEPFAGCSRLPEVLGYFARSIGSPGILIGHPRSEQSQSLAGMFREMGFEAATASTGRQLYQLAQVGADIELVLLSEAIDHPAADELIQMLRRDPQTAHLPVGLMAREGNLVPAAPSLEQDALVVLLQRPHSAQAAATATTRLLALAGAARVSPQRRASPSRRGARASGPSGGVR